MELRDAATLDLQRALVDVGFLPRTMTWAPDGTTAAIVATREEGEGLILDVLQEKVAGKFTAHRNAAAYSPDGKSLAAAAGEPIVPGALVSRPAVLPGVTSWTLASGEHRGGVRAVAYSPDG